MKIHETALAGVLAVELNPHADSRGAFTRLYCDRELDSVLGGRSVVQVNHSVTAEEGALRGLHYQRPPHAEMKLIRCLRGRAFDVAVDLRRGSPTFLQWVARELKPEEPVLWVIPEGCAHGFQSLAPDTELLYLHTAHYRPEAEAGLRHDDARLGIDWPLSVAEMSARDRGFAELPADFAGLETGAS